MPTNGWSHAHQSLSLIHTYVMRWEFLLVCASTIDKDVCWIESLETTKCNDKS